MPRGMSWIKSSELEPGTKNRYVESFDPDLRRVQRHVRKVRTLLNNRAYYPRARSHRDTVFLALFSKAIRVAEATFGLVARGFHEEAFGLSRTLLDLLITTRFIANKDTDDRAERFFNFLSVDTVAWLNVITTHYPGQALPVMPDFPKVKQMAASYPDLHKWAGKGMSARKLALEPSTWEFDDKGKPLTLQFLYEAVSLDLAFCAPYDRSIGVACG